MVGGLYLGQFINIFKFPPTESFVFGNGTKVVNDAGEPVISSPPAEVASSSPFQYVLSSDQTAIERGNPEIEDTQSILWISPTHRAISDMAQYDSKVCFGHRHGRITIIDLGGTVT
jgi:hypothetical protein